MSAEKSKTTCRCGRLKHPDSDKCLRCRDHFVIVKLNLEPTEQGITPLELLIALISMCEGFIS